MTSPGQGYQTNPDDLRGGATLLEQASVTDGVALGLVRQGDATASTVFGSSEQAAHLAAQWNAAVGARAQEIMDVRQQTDDQAASLRRNADEYESTEGRTAAAMEREAGRAR